MMTNGEFSSLFPVELILLLFAGVGLNCSTAPFDSDVIWRSNFNTAGVCALALIYCQRCEGGIWAKTVRTGGLLGNSTMMFRFHCFFLLP